MFDAPDSPEALLDSLERFLDLWLGPRYPWYGIAEEKLAKARLPEPLRRLYAFAGEWPGNNFWRSAFAYQACLIPFELLAVHQGKLVFLEENQGCWACGAETEGRDPPVWVKLDDDSWQPLGASLAPLLVTACLHEVLCGSKYKARAEGLMDRFRASGQRISPLWLNGPYVGRLDVSRMERQIERLSFSLIDGRALLLGEDWCGTNSEEFRDEFPGLFPPSEPSMQEPRHSIPTYPGMSPWVRKRMLQGAARSHEARVEHHLAEAQEHRRLAEEYRRLAEDI
jgi:hypothetical protein